MRGVLLLAMVVGCGSPQVDRSSAREQTAPRGPRAILADADRELREADACAATRDDCSGYASAASTLEELLRTHPSSDEASLALESLAYAYQRSGRWDDAAIVLSAAVCPERLPDPLARGVALPSAVELAACEPRRMPSLDTFLAWFRLGEHFFDAPDLERALAAFTRAVAIAPDDARYAETARYKLAWTLYRMDRYSEALEAFAPLVAATHAQIRTEALQYMAIILSEGDWDGDGADDALIGVERPEAQRWLDGEQGPALLLELARTLVDDARYAAAISACERFLARWPDDPRADEVRAQLERARAQRK